jgi:predicted O-methyltransferase YrrM
MTSIIKKAVDALVDGMVVPLVRIVKERIPESTVISELQKSTAEECAQYVQARMPSALQFPKKRDLLDHALGKAEKGGLVAEFGVFDGSSVNRIARMLEPSVVYGFDSFRGLGEDWAGWNLMKGQFDRGGRPPRVESNVSLRVGLFADTLPPFLAENPGQFSFIHVDCDTYPSAKSVLDLVGPQIQAGTILVFDEYFGYRGWRIGEFKAWQELVLARAIGYDYLAFSPQSVSIRVTRA